MLRTAIRALEIIPFDGGEPDHLTFDDGAAISIANISTTQDGDHDFDYLLNYGIMFDPLIEPAGPSMPPAFGTSMRRARSRRRPRAKLFELELSLSRLGGPKGPPASR